MSIAVLYLAIPYDPKLRAQVAALSHIVNRCTEEGFTVVVPLIAKKKGETWKAQGLSQLRPGSSVLFLDNWRKVKCCCIAHSIAEGLKLGCFEICRTAAGFELPEELFTWKYRLQKLAR